jgi:hypothetical protein
MKMHLLTLYQERETYRWAFLDWGKVGMKMFLFWKKVFYHYSISSSGNLSASLSNVKLNSVSNFLSCDAHV